MEIIFTKDFKKEFKKIKDNKTREKILKIIAKISRFPEIGKPLKYKLKNYRSLRIKPYRILYYLKEGKIYLNIIEHRKSAYK
jgi:addiction module RelE/StbE family toxin